MYARAIGRTSPSICCYFGTSAWQLSPFFWWWPLRFKQRIQLKAFPWFLEVLRSTGKQLGSKVNQKRWDHRTWRLGHSCRLAFHSKPNAFNLLKGCNDTTLCVKLNALTWCVWSSWLSLLLLVHFCDSISRTKSSRLKRVKGKKRTSKCTALDSILKHQGAVYFHCWASRHCWHAIGKSACLPVIYCLDRLVF